MPGYFPDGEYRLNDCQEVLREWDFCFPEGEAQDSRGFSAATQEGHATLGLSLSCERIKTPQG